jgi:hypothetical protein
LEVDEDELLDAIKVRQVAAVTARYVSDVSVPGRLPKTFGRVLNGNLDDERVSVWLKRIHVPPTIK